MSRERGRGRAGAGRRSVLPHRVGGMSFRRWRRLERQVRTRYERDVLDVVRGLAAAGACAVAEPAPPRQGTPAGPGARPAVTVLHGGEWRLVLVGAAVPDEVARGAGEAWRIASVGRYRGYWWLRLAPVAGGRPVPLLAVHLRLDHLQRAEATGLTR